MAPSNAKLFTHIRTLALSIEERNLLFLIASYRNEETFVCNPTQAKLSELSGIKQQRISRILTRLKKKKILQCVGVEVPPDMKKVRNHYAFYFDWEDVECCALLPDFKGPIEVLCCVGEKIRNGNGNRLLTHIEVRQRKDKF